MLYELKNLKKTYNQRTVLNLESLKLEKNKVLGLLGPNGAGKTTLLEIMAFLTRPSAGDIWFEKEWVDFTNGKLMMNLRRKVVLIQQQPILFTTTVFKNVEYPLKIRKTPKAERKKIVKELLKLVGMGMFEHASAHKLSGGETHRVAIAQVLACFPEVILMDEPTASVDVENQINIERIIKEINQKKSISVIFTTHNMIQASRLADKTVFLFEGKVARSIYENIFSSHIEVDSNGYKYCVLHSGLKLRVSSQKSGAIRISIDPSAVKLNKKEIIPSIHNSFKGTLVQLTDEQSRVRALVDVGIPLSILIPKEVFKSLHLDLGEEVWLNCPKESIDVF
ncbi:MAG: ATP-binding cassette domain-containing protein [Desulfobacteraceae bacterium]|uniref:ATP-binding cassette domain-containing protein n=1 Tax=Candidatus Desulfaltia bathyphila TaxID=2841697 RepID=A0A8J6T604_9BACT|nr:ATP-binding cassette domain-containing protein [Candidatus Desulfaltia bathyphila]